MLEDYDEVYLYPIGDTHIGHNQCDIEFLKAHLSSIPNLPNHRIILMGDLVDANIKSAIGGSVYEGNLIPNSQLFSVVNLFKPYQEQIDGILKGNHEDRIFKECGIDICEIIAAMLEVPYLKHSGVITYSFNKRAYNINAFHGKVGGTIENALRAVKAMSNKVFADIYLMGHCHNSAYTKREYVTIDSRNEKLVKLIQYFVLTGACLNYEESYADKMNLEISAKGFPVIKLHGNTPLKRIQVMT